MTSKWKKGKFSKSWNSLFVGEGGLVFLVTSTFCWILCFRFHLLHALIKSGGKGHLPDTTVFIWKFKTIVCCEKSGYISVKNSIWSAVQCINPYSFVRQHLCDVVVDAYLMSSKHQQGCCYSYGCTRGQYGHLSKDCKYFFKIDISKKKKYLEVYPWKL